MKRLAALPLLGLSLWMAPLPLSAQTPVLHSPSDSLLTRKTPANGSADVVTEDRMNKGLVTNPLEALNGQAAGVQISTGADRMASLASVRVRGTTSLTGGNDPLVIIDGVYSDLTALSGIYPGDIESFTILRNAAETAPYGSRGASGVIQVTTKRGHGGRFSISYDGNAGFESVYKNIEMLNASEYLSTARQLGLFALDGGYDTDFRKEMTRTGFVQNHHVAFSGGTAGTGYRASIGFTQNNMVVKTNGMTNFVAKIDLTQKAFDDALNVDLGVFGSSMKTHKYYEEQKLFYGAAAMNPTLPYDPVNGSWLKNQNASQINPPGALLNERDDDKIYNFNTHLKLDFNLLKMMNVSQQSTGRDGQDFHLALFGSYSYASNENGKFMPSVVWNRGEARRAEAKTDSWLANATLTYGLHRNIHDVKLTALFEYQQDNLRGFNTGAHGFTTTDLGYDNLGGGAYVLYSDQGSEQSETRTLSYMLQGEYTLLDRYTLTANVRADGSILFASNHRWGVFPSISATWDVKQEPFLKDITAITMMKLRTGYGLTGNTGGIGAYNAIDVVRPAGVVPWEGMSTVVYERMRNINPDLKWETRGTWNIGLDLGLLDNRLMLTWEFYTSKTWNMLYMYDVPVPTFTYDKLLANIGEMRNSGLELGLGITPLRNKDMQLDINMNLTYQKNKILSLSGNYNGMHLAASQYTPMGSLNGAGQHGGYNDVVYQIVGQPLGVFYLPHCTGIAKDAAGNNVYQIADLDHNGEINIDDGGDRYIAGQATPKWTLGSNISFRYKDFDISLQMNGAFGHKIFNGTSLAYMNMTSFPDYNVMKGAPQANIKDQVATDYWLEKGDYLNFDYLALGWNVPLRTNKVVQALRLSLNVNNLATITSYSGLTPMINSYIAGSTLGIDDKRSYPVYRTYSVGVSIQF